jgi:hypothetical protein
MSVLTDATYWLIQFEDAGKKAEIFTDEACARARYEQLQLNWNCHLFVQVKVIDHLRQERADTVQAAVAAALEQAAGTECDLCRDGVPMRADGKMHSSSLCDNSCHAPKIRALITADAIKALAEHDAALLRQHGFDASMDAMAEDVTDLYEQIASKSDEDLTVEAQRLKKAMNLALQAHVQAERERCAFIAETYSEAEPWVCRHIAAAIRGAK